jgi:hypothetical protein
MNAITMSTQRLRHLLGEIREKKSPYRVCSARDIIGPGGGVYITANSELDERHLAWLERRNPAPETPTYVEVALYKDEAPVSTTGELELPQAEEPPEKDSRERAENYSREVVERAENVVQQAEEVYRAVGKIDFSVADLSRGGADAGLRELEQRLGALRGAVKKALEEYLKGNTLVMELILKFQLDKRTVRHALNVAAFATEMACQLAAKEKGRQALEGYFGELSGEQLLAQLEEPVVAAEGMSAEEVAHKRRELFQRELVEIFLGGFMHDCGLWNEPFFLHEGHEVKGAKLVWGLKEVQQHAPALVKIVLFHSDLARLADRYGVVKIVEAPEDPEEITFKREFYRTLEDARAAVEMRPGKFLARILSSADLRKVLPVALAERYVSQTQDVHAKPRWEAIGELARYAGEGLFTRYMVALCNAQVEVIAPRRAWVKMAGSITVSVEDRKEGKRAQRLDVENFEAGSLLHGADRQSPHLITLFVRRADGSRARSEYVAPQDPALWERAASAESRMYIPAGRFKNNLALQVTGFVSEEVYGRILEEYERELKRRLEAGA